MALDRFSPATRAWFDATFAEPTPPQRDGWPAISAGEHSLILAPTGSGKTLAAFLWALDRITTEAPPPRAERCRVLYLSPLRALAVDIEKNLRAPLAGIRLAAERLGEEFFEPRVAIRTGDTSSRERAAIARHPPDLLITTPESLYLMLTSRAREILRSVEWVIVDEIHAVAATKRGTHLALSLERLTEIAHRAPQRIGLSATQRPLEEIARFLGGQRADGTTRPVTVVDSGSRKSLDLEVIVPIDDMTDPPPQVEGRAAPSTEHEPASSSIWPHVHPRLLELIEAHHTTLIFVNARRMAERLATRLNEMAGSDLVRAHHGSLSREQRLAVEGDLKSGRLRALVATSSLELGIDMGTVDLVVLVESPGSVARGMQRVGRAGHQVGAPSVGKVFPKFRGDLLEATTIAKRMYEGLVEEMRYPRNPLDVLAQQIVAAVAVDDWPVDDLYALVRRCAPFAELSREAFDSVLDLLAGRYPSDQFAGLRARLTWDRVDGRLSTVAGAQRVAVTNPGTIPDRGLFGVFLPDGTRVGELDEEMVYESRPGETFLLGASTWRITEITFDRVIVTPAPGEPARMPFWRGDRPGRPLELGRELGKMTRELLALDAQACEARLTNDYSLDARAAANLRAYLTEQREATGSVPDDRTVVIERFPDEIGDWRICILTPFGARVHAPWALALEERLARLDLAVQIMWSDDGIVMRLPEALDELPPDALVLDPDEVEELVVERLPSTSMFATHFRENAARALLLPRRRPGERTPLWQQRMRSADLLEVSSAFPSFPILLETSRECLRDVFDVPALIEVLTDIRSRRVRITEVDTRRASPFAQSLLFGWIATYMYEGDAPLAERRATALSLDRELLRDLLGSEELRDLLDADALAELELELQRLVEGRRARHADDLAHLLRDLGDLTPAEIAARSVEAPDDWIDELLAQRRAIRMRVGGSERIAAAEDAARLRDALGVALPPGLPAAFLESVEQPLDELVARFARTHGPFTPDEAAVRFATTTARVEAVLGRLVDAGRVVAGEFRPGRTGREWCDQAVLRRLRRRSLAVLRREVEAVDAETYARFLPAWQRVETRRRGLDALVAAVEQLQGAAIPASVLEREVLVARVDGYRPSMLDELCAAGELVWVGAGPIGTHDGRVRLFFRDRVAQALPVYAQAIDPPAEPIHDVLRDHLASAGASFWPDLVAATASTDDVALLAALWDLVWAGEVTNDTFAPLRAPRTGKRARQGRPHVGRVSRLGPPAGAGRWSLTVVGSSATTETESLHALAIQLLERHGVVTREAVRHEGVIGGFAAVYPVLKAMEDAGRVRRGYFVAGQGAAQFALPGAVDRLRGERHVGDDPVVRVLGATDPAQVYGAALSWPDLAGARLARTAGAHVVTVDGAAICYVERGGRSLRTFVDDDRVDVALEAIVIAMKDGRIARFEPERVNGEPVRTTEVAARLRALGFLDGYKGLRLRG